MNEPVIPRKSKLVVQGSIQQTSERTVNRPYVIQKYFLRSLDADRKVAPYGEFKKGVWNEVPYEVYLDFKRVIEEARGYGEVPGWEIKTS